MAVWKRAIIPVIQIGNPSFWKDWTPLLAVLRCEQGSLALLRALAHSLHCQWNAAPLTPNLPRCRKGGTSWLPEAGGRPRDTVLWEDLLQPSPRSTTGPEVVSAHSQEHRGVGRVFLIVCAGPSSSLSQTPEPPPSHKDRHSSRCDTRYPLEVQGTPRSSESERSFEWCNFELASLSCPRSVCLPASVFRYNFLGSRLLWGSWHRHPLAAETNRRVESQVRKCLVHKNIDQWAVCASKNSAAAYISNSTFTKPRTL